MKLFGVIYVRNLADNVTANVDFIGSVIMLELLTFDCAMHTYLNRLNTANNI